MAPRKSIDVSDNSELRRLAEEVARTGEECALVLGGEELAVISRAGSPLSARRPTEEEYEKFLSTWGSWEGLIDAEDFKRANSESRSWSRPAPTL